MHTTPAPASLLSLRRCQPVGLCALVLALAGCASKPQPQGYGVDTQGTAAEAQRQMQQAEQSTQINTVQTYLDLISRMQQAGQWYASLAHTEAFEQQYGPNTQVRLLRADALRNTSQFDAAKALYSALLNDKDRDSGARARRGLGLLYASQGQYAQAIAQLEQARQLNPIDANVLSDLAYAHMLNGNLAAAQIPVLQAAQLAPGNARAQLNLALYWLASGQHAQAQALLQRLSQPQAKNVPALIDQNSIQMLQTQLATVQQALGSSGVGRMRTPTPEPSATAVSQVDTVPVQAIAPITQQPAPATATPRPSLQMQQQLISTTETARTPPASPELAAAGPSR